MSTTQVVSIAYSAPGGRAQIQGALSALNDIALAWVLTLPATALLAVPIYYTIEVMLRGGG